jgi:hypothetical protein
MACPEDACNQTARALIKHHPAAKESLGHPESVREGLSGDASGVPCRGAASAAHIAYGATPHPPYVQTSAQAHCAWSTGDAYHSRILRTSIVKLGATYALHALR